MSRSSVCVIALLAFFFGASAAPIARAGIRTRSAESASPSTLQQAYRLLERADHDYHGHRIRAMHYIEEACRAMHTPVHGDGKGKEPQGTSDQQLAQARALLQSASPASTGRAAAHINHAIKELGIALKIR